MRKHFIISLILLSGLFSARVVAEEEPIKLQDNPPDSYVVVKGDTLWDISKRFLKDPWQWPQIWGMNREQIKNPHLIYPGDVVVLDRSGASPALRLVRGGDRGGDRAGDRGGSTAGGRETVKLGPRVRAEDLARAAIPTIPYSAIEPFLSQPLVIEAGGLDNAPRIIATQDQRVVLGAGDFAYVQDMPKDKGLDWQIYRLGKTFFDPESQEVLGYEAIYLGQAKVAKFAEASPIEIITSKQEINSGDRLAAAVPGALVNYVPRAPNKGVKARIISIYGGLNEGGPNNIVAISKGTREGLEKGHVLALYHYSGIIKNTRGEPLKLPDERYGLLLVFRTFEKVSYALVMQASRPVQVFDVAQTP
ncbi:MAG: LysM peptidoglycan-binding domain-containing protein [Burkholderiales bacterium]